MESLKAIRTMNDKHPTGRRSTCIAELCERVEELETAAHTVIDAWTAYDEPTPMDSALAALARVLLRIPSAIKEDDHARS